MLCSYSLHIFKLKKLIYLVMDDENMQKSKLIYLIMDDENM